ncbi:uncharacterized protein LOC125504909 [Dendroctonus ponderosae]|uniref:PID domain-containing protein n=1 Tax=Dendroctonus ponderosae TaxID=77166 RepID=J3JYB6_DENPD|nr:uncharacterized protein LOC125504909 [Dendroctonus ponderosae]AEE63201.1 unknown [Dendroctonus ponderosae]
MDDKEAMITINDLPLTFMVKYLGHYPSKGLWGIKHTRKPVDNLVNQAKLLPAGKIMPMVSIEISADGFAFSEAIGSGSKGATTKFSVDVISYGVQDLVYTRVFSMIIVADEDLKSDSPFLCHSFVCDSREQARRITYALAIDLRTPEEQAANSDGETDA